MIGTSKNYLSMDTHNQREGLHVWVVGTAEKLGTSKNGPDSISIHLTREQARQLVNEIQQRLF